MSKMCLCRPSCFKIETKKKMFALELFNCSRPSPMTEDHSPSCSTRSPFQRNSLIFYPPPPLPHISFPITRSINPSFAMIPPVQNLHLPFSSFPPSDLSTFKSTENLPFLLYYPAYHLTPYTSPQFQVPGRTNI